MDTTFTEAEVTLLVDFYNLVCTKAKFDITAPEAVKLATLMQGYKKHLDKVNDSVLEVIRITKAKKDGE
jgi:hypothetical protein